MKVCGINIRSVYKAVFILIILGILTPVVQAQFPFVTPVSWRNDGSQVASIANNIVEVRNVPDNQLLYTLIGHTDLIPIVVWSPDDTMIATPSFDQTVKIWNSATGELLHTLTGHNDAVTSVVWSNNSRRLTTFGLESDPSVFIWDAISGDLLSTHNAGSVTDVVYSPNGTQLAISSSLSLEILNAETFQEIITSPRVACCTNQMYSIAWSPTENLIASGSINGLVTLWDVNTLLPIRQFNANSYFAPDSREVDNLSLSWVRDVTFSPDGSTVLSVSGDGSVREWDVTTGELVNSLQIAPLYTATWSAYAAQLAVVAPPSVDTLSLSQSFDATNTGGEIQFVVPDPSPERLQAIAEACDAPPQVVQAITQAIADVPDTLSAVVDTVEALPTETVPPGCAADLIAVAEAIQAQGE